MVFNSDCVKQLIDETSLLFRAEGLGGSPDKRGKNIAFIRADGNDCFIREKYAQRDCRIGDPLMPDFLTGNIDQDESVAGLLLDSGSFLIV